MPKIPKLAASNGQIDDIRCVGEVVPIDSLIPDPNNARLHPDRNMEAIKESLATYGQMVPLVVRSQNRMIAAGNGRWAGMREMGWTKVAVSFRAMTDAEFMGYALADNRTAELAKWDFEVVARLDKLLAEQQQSMIGWSSKDIEYLRTSSEFVAPPDPLAEQDPTELWQGMPEFDQQDQRSFRVLIVHFRNEEDVQKFERLIGYSIDSTAGGAAGKSIWFPQMQTVFNNDLRY